MTLIKTYDVQCDFVDEGKRCTELAWGTVARTGQAQFAARQARDNVAKAGWRRRDGRDLCPSHAGGLPRQDPRARRPNATPRVRT